VVLAERVSVDAHQALLDTSQQLDQLPQKVVHKNEAADKPEDVTACAILPADASQARINLRAVYSAGSHLRLVCMHLMMPWSLILIGDNTFASSKSKRIK
jgi:hypothetical protein